MIQRKTIIDATHFHHHPILIQTGPRRNKQFRSLPIFEVFRGGGTYKWTTGSTFVSMG